MKLKTVFTSINYANLLLLVLNVLNQWGAIFPGVDVPPWVLKAQILLGILTPSLGGFAHRMAFAEAQTPGDRTAAEVTSSAVAASATLIAAAPVGQPVAVPSTTETVVAGTKPPTP